MTGGTLIKTARHGMAQFLFVPILLVIGGSDTHDAFRTGFHPGVLSVGCLVDEQIILTTLEIQVGSESFNCMPEWGNICLSALNSGIWVVYVWDSSSVMGIISLRSL